MIKHWFFINFAYDRKNVGFPTISIIDINKQLEVPPTSHPRRWSSRKNDRKNQWKTHTELSQGTVFEWHLAAQAPFGQLENAGNLVCRFSVPKVTIGLTPYFNIPNPIIQTITATSYEENIQRSSTDRWALHPCREGLRNFKSFYKGLGEGIDGPTWSCQC